MMKHLNRFLVFLLCIALAKAFILWNDFAKSESPKTNAGCPCMEYNSSETSMVYSPNYPDDYGNNQECLYLITAPEGNIVHIHFTRFYTEFKRDQVEIFDGHVNDSRLMGAHSGAEIPTDYYSTGNLMTLRFSTDPTFTYRGFAANCYNLSPSPNATNGTM